ncbi:RFX DNA-binding domain-containing protein [Dichotomocladium elegans]|nr:RFX DNA-binding domain-containing protein [Dichotomocladium elegans]
MTGGNERRQRPKPVDIAQNAATVKWLQDNYKYDPDQAENGVQRASIYAHYIAHAKANADNEQAVNSATLGKLVKHVFPWVKTRRLGHRGRSKYYYCGISRIHHLPLPLSPSRLPLPVDDQQQAQSPTISHQEASFSAGQPEPPSREPIILPPFTSPLSMNAWQKQTVDQFTSIYHQHCADFLNGMIDQHDINAKIRTFYTELPSDIRHCLFEHIQLSDALWHWDCVLYDTIIFTILPRINADVPDTLREYLQTCMATLPDSLQNVLTDYPEAMMRKKMAVLRMFIAKLHRCLLLNQLALSANRTLIANMSDMYDGWSQINLEDILDRADWMAPGSKCLAPQFAKVCKLLEPGASRSGNRGDNAIGDWIEWINETVEGFMITPLDTIASSKEAIQIWLAITNLILRELQLQKHLSSASQDAFRQVWIFSNDYVIYLVEEAIAKRNITAVKAGIQYHMSPLLPSSKSTSQSTL